MSTLQISAHENFKSCLKIFSQECKIISLMLYYLFIKWILIVESLSKPPLRIKAINIDVQQAQFLLKNHIH
jgi:hypothetical protein